tara:strand:- start:246 stop:611 length:366 start_codon:yes stop_codon:yes gene_type:complete
MKMIKLNDKSEALVKIDEVQVAQIHHDGGLRLPSIRLVLKGKRFDVILNYDEEKVRDADHERLEIAMRNGLPAICWQFLDDLAKRHPVVSKDDFECDFLKRIANQINWKAKVSWTPDPNEV